MGRWLGRLAALEGEDHDQHPAPGSADPPEPVTLPPPDSAAIDRAMERAVIGLPILPGEFRQCIDDDEAIDCATGRIPIESARAYARLFAQELAQDPDHPTNHGKVTCWHCRHFRPPRCTSWKVAEPDHWIECAAYEARKEARL